MKYILLTCALFFMQSQLNGQCYENRHNTSLNSGWLSCDQSTNPNPIRGESHWILYDLGHIYEVQESYFWNQNHPETFQNGLQNLVIDVSIDGSEWFELVEFSLDQAPVSSFYEGVEGPDLSGNNARYVLITGLSNYGGTCFGLSEVKINVGEALPTTTEQINIFSDLALLPNPADQQTILNINATKSADAIVKVYDNIGREMQSQSMGIVAGENQLIIETKSLIPGIYQVSILNETHLKTIELIIQR